MPPLELDPEQPDAVAAAIAQLLPEAAERPVDPWWAAGLAQRLGGDDGAPAEDAWSRARVVDP
jgi:hypothetical protein